MGIQRIESYDRLRGLLEQRKTDKVVQMMREKPINITYVAQIFGQNVFDDNIISTAAKALNACQDAGLDTSLALRELRRLASHGNPIVRISVSSVFCNAARNIAPSDEAFSLLHKSLLSRDPRLREHTACIFRQIGLDCERIPIDKVALLEELEKNDPCPEVRREAASALKALSGAYIKARNSTQ